MHRWSHKLHTQKIHNINPQRDNTMPTRRKIPRKNSGTKRTGRYQNSPDASIQKSAKPPSKFRNTIGYKKSARKMSPATTRKNSPKSSSDSSYEYKSESEK